MTESAGPARVPEAGADGTRPRGPARPRFTSRAAVLAVVVCAIALSLAYPVREYISQRRQVDRLEAQRQQIAARVKQLQATQRELASPAYIERQARDRLHMCRPRQTCYVIIGAAPAGSRAAAAGHAGSPWYERVWSSVQQADHGPAR